MFSAIRNACRQFLNRIKETVKQTVKEAATAAPSSASSSLLAGEECNDDDYDHDRQDKGYSNSSIHASISLAKIVDSSFMLILALWSVDTRSAVPTSSRDQRRMLHQ